VKTVKWLILMTLFTLAACSKQGAQDPQQQNEGATIGNGAYLKMMADLSDAESLTSNVAKKGEKKQLFKLTFDKKLAVVLSGEHELISYKLTPTHIIARVNIVEGLETCSLVAIPKIKGRSKVLCLNRDLVGCDEQKFNDRSGYDVRGSEVFFTHQKNVKAPSPGWNEAPKQFCYASSITGESPASTSELRRWDGFSEHVETLFHTDPQNTKDAQMFVRDVFASKTNTNLCIDTANTGSQSIYCRTDGSEKWNKVKEFGNHYEWRIPFLKMGNSLFGESYKRNGGGILNLETLEITERNGNLPQKVDFVLENGGMIGRDGTKVIVVQPEGKSEKILEIGLEDAQPARLGSHAWYADRDSLRRVDLRDGALEQKDYFENVNLLNITGLSWALNDFLQLDGTTPRGFGGTTYLDNAGNLVSAQERSVPLEHPITLQWNQ